MPPSANGQTIGLRDDIVTNGALKAELSRFDSNHPTHFTTALTPIREVDVASVGDDFVF